MDASRHPDYLLTYDAAEVQRLQLQHNMIIRAFGGHLIVASIELSPGMNVLDSAAGTGVWTLQAAAQHPNAKFSGIDIESRDFPISPPSNARFLVEDITALPEEWFDTFDLVHQRLLIAALRAEEWPQAIAEAHRALRLGGWAQFVECSTLWLRGPIARCFLEIYRALYNSRNMLLTCAEDIPQMLEDAGFRNVRSERVYIEMAGTTPEATAARTTIVGVYRQFKDAIMQAGGFGLVESGEEYDALMSELEKEIKTGIDGTYPLE
ncbi:S-adenosyl-L-methionine-dependent methyltransferase [Schizophyllum commune H4-8]|uniref:Methyltransferase domain-containing protein n=1 Tax=Schizophyllum commune (strain H4-8 / FGSC 9210) TaxID=578458 RepID=D8QHE7_SCHCM|nr:S-adenosyl-L-methionine-dependent methyltransferase [Schizophyllum commune H4-8]KAI5887157.1 S-adenosyl-L-methionine-dependent methyltransferase [Schizophyllum commune H4-8]